MFLEPALATALALVTGVPPVQDPQVTGICPPVVPKAKNMSAMGLVHTYVIHGANLGGVTRVKFDGIEGDVVFAGDNLLVVRVRAPASTGIAALDADTQIEKFRVSLFVGEREVTIEGDAGVVRVTPSAKLDDAQTKQLVDCLRKVIEEGAGQKLVAQGRVQDLDKALKTLQDALTKHQAVAKIPEAERLQIVRELGLAVGKTRTGATVADSKGERELLTMLTQNGLLTMYMVWLIGKPVMVLFGPPILFPDQASVPYQLRVFGKTGKPVPGGAFTKIELDFKPPNVKNVALPDAPATENINLQTGTFTVRTGGLGDFSSVTFKIKAEFMTSDAEPQTVSGEYELKIAAPITVRVCLFIGQVEGNPGAMISDAAASTAKSADFAKLLEEKLNSVWNGSGVKVIVHTKVGTVKLPAKEFKDNVLNVTTQNQAGLLKTIEDDVDAFENAEGVNCRFA